MLSGGFLAAAALAATLVFAGCGNSGADKVESAVSNEVSGADTQSIGGLTLPNSTGTLTPKQAETIAQAGYVFGFPLVAMKSTMDQVTNVPKAEAHVAPVNQFNTPSKPLTPAFTAIPGVPVDMLFSNAWLDLSKEPLVFTMPDTGGIYNQMTLVSGWSNVLEAPGARTTGTGQQDYLIAGPGWEGKTPEGVKLIK